MTSMIEVAANGLAEAALLALLAVGMAACSCALIAPHASRKTAVAGSIAFAILACTAIATAAVLSAPAPPAAHETGRQA